ncbi:MAG TPA: hypothetical protein VGN63_15950 [Flavisolibacter sp.]|nr:hypothetical protein [Flavisolibacter sp.]
MKKLKRIQSISSPTLTQAAMAHFLQNGRYDFHLKALRKALHTQCLRYSQSLLSHFPADAPLSRPEGGFVLWVELNPAVDVFTLRADAMAQHIAIVPGKIVEASCKPSQCLLILFGKPWNDDMDWGLKLLGDLVKKQLK